MVNNHRVALPLSEDLARQVDEFRLEQWEDEQLERRVWAALYRCLRRAGADNGNAERLQQVFTRLCRLDINQALTPTADDGDAGPNADRRGRIVLTGLRGSRRILRESDSRSVGAIWAPVLPDPLRR